MAPRRRAFWLLAISAFAGLLLSPAPALFARDDYPRSAAIDVLHYDLNLAVGNSDAGIRGEAGIDVAFRSAPPKLIELDLAGLVVDSVRVDNQTVTFARDGARLRVELPVLPSSKSQVRLAITYHGSPSDGLLIRKNKFGDRTVFADNWPDRAHYWFPAVDHPYDKATVDFTVTAPDRYEVIANGRLVETRSLQDGNRLTRWSQSTPIPTYCMVIGAAEFAVINAGSAAGSDRCIPVAYYLYPKDRDRGIKDFGRASQMLDFYQGLIGPYPYDKLALIQSSTRFGGMENASAIFFDERAFTGEGKLEGTVAHEIAHQWFGDSVTEADWHHLWLSEGFATYFGNLFFERVDGSEKLKALMAADRDSYLKSYGADPRPIYDPTIRQLDGLLNANNYQKGGWVLHMLRREMGDLPFFAGIRDYYASYRDKNALTADLQKVMEARAGRPLGWFFDQWVFGRGYPKLAVSWQWLPTASELRVRVRQEQRDALFRLPLDLAIDTPGSTRRETITVSQTEETFVFPLSQRPTALRSDADVRLLAVITTRENRN